MVLQCREVSLCDCVQYYWSEEGFLSVQICIHQIWGAERFLSVVILGKLARFLFGTGHGEVCLGIIFVIGENRGFSLVNGAERFLSEIFL